MAELNYGLVVVYSDQVLGCGAYGEVCKAKCGQLPCAAKALHKKLFDYQDPGEENLLKKFEGECKFLGNIKHPNIIQYLGTSTEKSGRPVLLMEMMDESLTKLLEKLKLANSCLPYSLQVSICCDITLALSYLHLNNIIHRDLSSNNVLLLGTRAKVADFGVSTLFDKNLKYLTACPGSRVYMPPEALFDPPVYSEKLDCFSVGVIAIQIATLNYPDPGPFAKLVENSLSTARRLQEIVPEVERRGNDIKLVPSDHPLLQMALNCLKDKDLERPSAQDLCEELVARKSVYKGEEGKSKEGNERSMGNTGEFEETSADGFVRDSLIQSLLQELEVKTQLLKALQRDCNIVGVSEVRTFASEAGLALETSGPVSEGEESGGGAYDGNASGRKASNVGTPTKANTSEESVSTREGVEVAFTEKVPAGGIPHEGDVSDEIRRKISITGWLDEPAPYSLSAYDGTAVFDSANSRAYFLKKYSLYLYQYKGICEDGIWSQLIDVNYQYCGLALINRMLTTVCGRSGLIYMRSLFTLTGAEKSDMAWSEVFDKIPTARESPACVSTSTHLIVLGGVGSIFYYSHCVEVLDLRCNQWLQATNIPDLHIPQAVIGGDILYLSSNEYSSLYACPIEDLLESVVGTDAKKKLPSSLWKRLQSNPTHLKSSIVAFRGGLLAVGGEGEDGKVTKEVYFYRKDTNWWEEIGELPTSRKFVLSGVLPGDRIMCVGGQSDTSSNVTTVNIGQMRQGGGLEFTDAEPCASASGSSKSCVVM